MSVVRATPPTLIMTKAELTYKGERTAGRTHCNRNQMRTTTQHPALRDLDSLRRHQRILSNFKQGGGLPRCDMISRWECAATDDIYYAVFFLETGDSLSPI